MKPLTFKTKFGTEIVYRVVKDTTKGIPLVCSGGLGGTHLIWSALVKHLRTKHPIVIWDYPGLSTEGSSYHTIQTDVPTLAVSLNDLLAHLNIPKAVLIGWSLGPQVSLELSKLSPPLAACIIAICGVSGKPFQDNVDAEPFAAALGLRSAVPGAVTWLSDKIDRIEKLKHLLKKIDNPTRFAKRFGFVDPTVDDLIFDAVIRDFIDLPPKTYRNYVLAAAKHDSLNHLKKLPIPLLVIAGEEDTIIPVARAKKMASHAPKGEFLKVKGGTHFLPLEYPQLLTLKITDFLKRHNIK